MLLGSIIRGIVPDKLINTLRYKLGFPSQHKSFNHLKNLGYIPKTVLDIGAYEGHWSKEFKAIFPDAAILMIEGQQRKDAQLKEIANSLTNATYKIALLGSEEKEIEFNIYETASSVLTEDNETNAIVEKRTLQLLDNVVQRTPFERPGFIKIDTQGYELEILKGGLNTLKYAEMVLLEVSLLSIYNNCPLAHDVILFMKAQGFVLYDICSLIKRPYDRALYQSDFLFIKETSSLRASTRWR
jgi:FkbM family methyltransferase